MKKLILSGLTALTLGVSNMALSNTIDELSITPLEQLELGISYDEESKTIAWVGQFTNVNWITFSVFAEMYDIETIYLHSGGGLTDIGVSLHNWIKDNNISVRVERHCDSACAYAALGSDNIYGKGMLGFHLPYLKSNGGHAEISTTDIGYILANEQNNNMINFMKQEFKKSKYISADIYNDIVNTSSEDVFIDVTVEELNKHKNRN
jgi:hypothetical protein